MAIRSQVFEANDRGRFKISLVVEQISKDTASNSSQVKWELDLHALKSWHFYDHTYYVNVDINGSNVYSSSAKRGIDPESSIVLASGTTTVWHNNDGAKTIAVGASINPGKAVDYNAHYMWAGGNFELERINRIPTSPKVSFNSKTSSSITVTAGASTITPDSYNFYINGSESQQASATRTFSGLASGTNYNIKVQAHGPGGWSGWSSAIDVRTYYKTSISLRVTGRTTSSISLAWSSNVGLSEQYYSIDNGSSWRWIDAGARSVNVTGLTPNKTYYFQVKGKGSESAEWGYSNSRSESTFQTITASLQMTSRDLNSASFSFTTNIEMSEAQYSDGRGWKNLGTRTSFTVGDYAPGESRHMTVRAKGKASGEWSGQSNTIYFNLMNLPTLTRMQGSFESSISGLGTADYSSEVKVYLIESNIVNGIKPITKKVSHPSWSTMDIDISLDQAEKDKIYKLFPNSNDVNYRICAEQSCNGKTYYNTDYYYTDRIVNANPTFESSDLSYTESQFVGLTGNNQKVIEDHNTFNAKIVKQMRTHKYAAPNRYTFSIEGDSAPAKTVQANQSLTASWNNIYGKNLLVTAYDSRGNFATARYPIDIIRYNEPVLDTGSISFARKDFIGTHILSNFSGTFTGVNFGAKTNTIKSVKLFRRKEGEENWTETEIVGSTRITSSTFSTENKEINDLIFDFGVKYFLKIGFSDEVVTIQRSEIYVIDGGKMSFTARKSNNSVGIGKIPSGSLPSGSLDVEGELDADKGAVIQKKLILGKKEGRANAIDSALPFYGVSAPFSQVDLNTFSNLAFGYGNDIINGPWGFKYGYTGTIPHHSAGENYNSQFFTVAGSNNNPTFIRQKYNDVFSDWQQVLTSNGETNGTMQMPGTGALTCYFGGYYIYDSNITITFTETTSDAKYGVWMIAAQNSRVQSSVVEGDKDGDLASRCYYKVIDEGIRGKAVVELYFKANSYAKVTVNIKTSPMMFPRGSCYVGVNSVPSGALVSEARTFKGEKGPKGDTGARGPQGPAGPTDLKKVYPVGAIYISSSSTSPASLFGGTWQQMKDRFLYATGHGYGYSNSTGTNTASHALTIAEMPAHWHEMQSKWTTAPWKWPAWHPYIGYEQVGYETNNNPVGTTSTGGNAGHSHEVPHFKVYMWRRTG